MNRVRPAVQPTKPGKRYPLLLYRRLSEQVFWPGTLIFALTAVLLFLRPSRLEPFRAYLSVVLSGTGLIMIFTHLLQLRAYVRCEPACLCLQLPFYRLNIPYAQIKAGRPTELYRLFPLEELRLPQRNFLKPLLGRTVIVLDLEQSPRHHLWLRLWMSRYMLSPHTEGLVVLVRDWLGFHNELDEYRARSPRD